MVHLLLRFSILFFLLIPHLVASQKGRFYSFTTSDGLTNNYIDCITQDKTGYIWVATRLGLNRYNGSEFKNFYHDQSDSTSLPFNGILTLYVDSSNTLWLGSYGSKIASFDRKTEKFKSYRFAGGEETKDLDVLEIFPGTRGEICLFTRMGIYTFDGTQFVLTKPSTGRRYQSFDTLVVGKETWIATMNGLKHVSQEGNTTVYNTRNTPELKSNSFLKIFLDKSGNIWFGTHGGGLVELAAPNRDLHYFSNHNIDIENNIIYSFYRDKDNKLWVATDGGGISVFDQDNTLLKHLNTPGYPESNSVLKFAEDDQGILWAVGWESGVFAINTSSYKVTSYLETFKKARVSIKIKALAVKGDTVLCGTFDDGLVLLNRKTGQITSRANPSRGYLGTQLYINDLLVDTENDCWVGSTRGLYRYTGSSLEYYPTDIHDNDNIDKKLIWSISVKNRDEIFVSTAFMAYILDKKTRSMSIMNIGLNGQNDVKFILKDNMNNLWLGSYDNLYMVKNNKTVTSIKLSKSAYSSDIFNPHAVYQDNQQTLYVGTQDGFYAFKPESIDTRNTTPEIILESFSVKNSTLVPGETPALAEHINEARCIYLEYNDFPAALTFTSINYNQQTAIKFSYKVEGLDSNWMPVNGQNALVFHGLKPGIYTLKLRNTNKYGRWSTLPRSLRVVVHPPVWETWWFKVVVLVVVLMAIVIIFRLRVRRLRIQKKHLQEEVNNQTRELKEKNAEIMSQKKTLEEQSDMLQEKIFELHEQKADLEAFNSELADQSSELLDKNEQLTSLIDNRTKLLSIIAHDIKNPFNTILIASKELQESDTAATNKKMASRIDFIHSASKNVYSIVSNLLDWAMSQSGMISSNPRNFNFQDFITRLSDSIKDITRQKLVTISVSCSESLWCYADESMVGIIIRNLIQNSVKFTPEGGMISILCSAEGANVKVEIIDTGIGMDANMLASLFDVKSVISEKGTRDEEGRGLGLLVVKEFLDKNDGSIEVLSKKNKGSNFIIRLPRGAEERDAPAANETADYPATRLDQVVKNESVTLLLVEDNDRLLEQLSQTFGEYYQVRATSNVPDAMTVLKTEKIDIVVSDIVMGSVDGMTLCTMIKEDLHLSIPIILITGVVSSEIQLKAYEIGVDAYFKKPFEFNLLNACVQNLLKSREKESTDTFRLLSKNKSADEIFVEKLKSEVEKKLSHPDFSVEMLAQDMGYSRVSLYRKVKKNVGITPNEYIHMARLQVAARLLAENKLRVAEVAYTVGFSDPHYFSNCFTRFYGVSPTNYRSQTKK